MKRKLGYRLLLGVLVTLMLATTVFAGSNEDGEMLRRNVSKTPDQETGHAGMTMMSFYVPAQSSNGEPAEIDYNDAEGADVTTRTYAQPLLINYVDGIEGDEEEHDDGEMTVQGGVSFGARDAFVALSLDDGVSWKRANVSNHASHSSFTLANGTEYPGDAATMVHDVAGNRVLAAWISKYCLGGEAAYTLKDEDENPIYPDYFGVAGSQGSVDYTLQGHPEVGEVPFGCVWTARGELLYNAEDSIYDITWTKPERLTSGRRDPNRLEIAAADDAGFVIVWQEDPEGLKPGTGEGPGEGWSGAIANAKTDIWYSYIGWEEFDDVCADDACDPDGEESVVPLADYVGDTQPKVATPMAVPVRLTDNNKCQITKDPDKIDPYCYVDFSADEVVIPDTVPTLPDANATFCVDTILWTTENGGTQDVCVTADDLPLLGRVAATRPRIALHGYDQDGDGTNDSAWVVLGYEETKALGEGTLTEEILDEGKNLWYQSFDMFEPDLVSHGNMLNQPAKDPRTDDFFPSLNTDDDAGLEYGMYAYDFYETEIGRRFSLISQDAADAGDTGTVAFTLIKQGIIKQGGPADIFARRMVIPEEFDAAVDNPYAFENMACETWAFADGSNAFYPKGVCLDDPPNLSGTIAVDCDGAECPTLDDIYLCENEGTEDEVCEFVIGDFTRVTEWDQTEETLTEQSWENPFDIAKGHRGFMDGDFIQVLYAWSPNYKQNAVGHDHYNLYVRRSFDGGITWTTTPSALGGDGTTTCENFGWGNVDTDVYRVCTGYAAGAFEKARNVSQLIGSRDTILDPRYSPTTGDVTECMVDGVLGACDSSVLWADTDPFGADDTRDPSKFFIVYETGDNTTVVTGEATPLDLFYSRATDWGDDYDLFDPEGERCDLATYEDTFDCSFDWLEKGDPESGEAAITGSAGGAFFYAAWNQALEIGEEEFTDNDAYFRRAMYLDNWDGSVTAAITYQSATAVAFDDEVSFRGAARDSDRMGDIPGGIVEYEWTSDIQGFLSDQRSWSRQAGQSPGQLWRGFHTISFRAKDDEGNWSLYSNTTVLVAEEIFTTFLPTVLR